MLGRWDGSDGIGGWGIADLGSNVGEWVSGRVGEWASRWAIDHGTGWGGRGHWSSPVPWGRLPLNFSKMLQVCIRTTVCPTGLPLPGQVVERRFDAEWGEIFQVQDRCAHQGLCPVPVP